MPRGDGTGRLGRGKDCDKTAKADRMGRRPNRPMDGRGQGLGQRNFGRGRRGRR